jgi:hypothetical protein
VLPLGQSTSKNGESSASSTYRSMTSNKTT